MKNVKHTPRTWTIIPNTDAVDISDKCLGLCPRRSTIPQDVADYIHKDRGLHIQIRHNKDPQTYAQANELSRLISAAPELLEALEHLRAELCEEEYVKHSKDAIRKVKAAIRKAKGE